VAGNPFNQVAYPAYPRKETHPDRLAAIGTLLGMHPAPAASCRMLEIGCSNGGNLLPMAYALPGSRFLGIDLAETAIEEGRAMAAGLGLENIAFEAADLRNIGARHGEFDYIAAHGVYSWIPPDIRDSLLAVCRERLAPEGICFISYNTLPGGYIRQMMRDMLLYHVRDIDEPERRIEQARWFLQFLLENKSVSATLSGLLESEARTLLKRDDSTLFHDDLAPVDHFVYFRDFAAHAQRHGLQFLGEAETAKFLAELADPGNVLRWLDGGVTEREQYIDFLRLNRFRQTLLCHEGIALDRNLDAARMERFLFSAPARPLDENQVEGYHGARVTLTHEAARRVTAALGEAYPAPVAFAKLLPCAGERSALESILYGLTIGGFAEIHVHAFPFQETVTDKPAASRLARHQALWSPYVTNLCHNPVQLDQAARNLLGLLDGTRDHASIARDWAATPGAPPREQIERQLPGNLQGLAKLALLEG